MQDMCSFKIHLQNLRANCIEETSSFPKMYVSSSKPPVPANLHTRQVFISKNIFYSSSSKPPVPANLHTRQVFISENISYSSSSKPPVPANLHEKRVFISAPLNIRYRQICMSELPYIASTQPLYNNFLLEISGVF